MISTSFRDRQAYWIVFIIARGVVALSDRVREFLMVRYIGGY